MINHKIQYKIYFSNPVDYFNIVLQKQIDLKLKFKIDENEVIVVDLTNDERFIKSNFFTKYNINFNDSTNLRFSFLTIINSPDKYVLIKKIYEILKQNYEDKINYQYESYYEFVLPYENLLNHIQESDKIYYVSYEEFEYQFDLMFEEFKLFLDKFEFNKNEKRIIEAFTIPDIKSNIKFIGWIDFF